jgi:hypothetical protein
MKKRSSGIKRSIERTSHLGHDTWKTWFSSTENLQFSCKAVRVYGESFYRIE